MHPLAYSVGGLLYAPADNPHVAGHILRGDWPCLTALCLCLEDSVRDGGLAAAQEQLKCTLEALRGADTPLLFVRVRTPEHLKAVHEQLGAAEELLTGYVFPKFDLGNAQAFLLTLEALNARRDRPLQCMPILESLGIARADTRRRQLRALRDLLDGHRERIVNVRVGGNDFCNLYGLRRGVDQSIYDLGVVRDILVDIVNLFSDGYVVSGPVWEYYGAPGGAWEVGLRRELKLDLANGFLGKTAIHPSQLPVIFDALKVSEGDAADARAILGRGANERAVFGGAGGRMNEVKCHGRWAEGILRRAEVYGVREAEEA